MISLIKSRAFNNIVKFFGNNKSSIIVGLLLSYFLGFTIYVWDYLTVPLFWDETTVYGRAIIEFSQRFFETLYNSSAYFNHPPFWQIFLAPIFKLTGDSIFSLRLFFLCSHFIGAWYLFKIFKDRDFDLIGLLAVIFYLSVPEIFVQSTTLIWDNLFANLFIIYVYFTLKNNFFLMGLVGVLIGLTRETGVSACVFSFVFIILNKKLSLKNFIYSSSAVLSLGLFFLFLFIIHGDFLLHQAFQEGHINSSTANIAQQFNHVFDLAFIVSGKETLMYLTVFTINIALGIWIYKTINEQEDQRLSEVLKITCAAIAYISVYIFFFSFHSEPIQRYFHSFIFLAVILIFYTLRLIHPWLVILVFMTNIPGFSSFYNRKSDAIGTYHEYTTQYYDVYENQMAAIDYLEEYFPKDTIIYAGWPLVVMLQDSSYGWCTRCFDFITSDTDERFDVYVWSTNLAYHHVMEKGQILKSDDFRLVESFKRLGSVVEVYQRK